MAKDKLVTLADQLEQTLDLRARLEAELIPILESEKKIRAELCRSLLNKGLQYVRTTSGMGFGMVKGRVTYAIKKGIGIREKAVQWAVANYPGILTISAPDLASVVGPMMPNDVPEFVERKEGAPHLSVRTTEE